MSDVAETETTERPDVNADNRARANSLDQYPDPHDPANTSFLDDAAAASVQGDDDGDAAYHDALSHPDEEDANDFEEQEGSVQNNDSQGEPSTEAVNVESGDQQGTEDSAAPKDGESATYENVAPSVGETAATGAELAAASDAGDVTTTAPEDVDVTDEGDVAATDEGDVAATDEGDVAATGVGVADAEATGTAATSSEAQGGDATSGEGGHKATETTLPSGETTLPGSPSKSSFSTKHPGPPFVCPHCDREFRNSQGLGGHIIGCELKHERKRKREEELADDPNYRPNEKKTKGIVGGNGLGAEVDVGAEENDDGKMLKGDRRKANKGAVARKRYTPTEKAELILEYENSEWKGTLRDYCEIKGLGRKFLKFLSEATEGGWRYPPTREAIMIQAEAIAKGEIVSRKIHGRSKKAKEKAKMAALPPLKGGLEGTRERFKDKGTAAFKRVVTTLEADKCMGVEDCKCLLAYAKGAAQVDIMTEEDERNLTRALHRIRREHAGGKFRMRPSDRDIHDANIRRLGELVSSDTIVKLETGLSKHDQIATVTRMWALKQLKQIQKDLGLLLELGSEYAREHIDILMAGYNNLVPSQTVRFSHWLMSHMTALMRDGDRLKDTLRRLNVCPFGASGNVFGIDRLQMCQDLGFTGGLSTNSLDSVADRDYVFEFCTWASLMLTHLSQMAEDLIVSNMLQGIEQSNDYATPHPLLRHQKAPDALELLRTKAGTMMGKASGLMCSLKGLPRAYNRDLQEANLLLFEAVDLVTDCIAIATGVISTMRLKPDNMINALRPDMLTKDLGDYLIRKGVPSPETRNIASRALRLAEELTINISSLTLEQLQHIDPRFEDDVMEIWDYELSVERHDAVGGTGRDSVMQQIDACVLFARSLQQPHPSQLRAVTKSGKALSEGYVV